MSIVIVTHNQLEFTRLCVVSIEQHTTEPHELILIDNASTDGTVEYVKSLGEQAASAADPTNPLRRVTVVVNTENQGFPKAANQGIQAATGQQIVLINNDTIVTAGWLTRLLRALESDPKVGMVGPVSNFVSGPQQIDVPYQGSGFGVRQKGSIAKGLLRAEGRLAHVLKCVETEYAAACPRTLDEALAVVERATELMNLEIGTGRFGPTGEIILQNVGGVVTTIKNTGEVIVERGGDVIIHLGGPL